MTSWDMVTGLTELKTYSLNACRVRPRIDDIHDEQQIEISQV